MLLAPLGCLAISKVRLKEGKVKGRVTGHKFSRLAMISNETGQAGRPGCLPNSGQRSTLRVIKRRDRANETTVRNQHHESYMREASNII